MIVSYQELALAKAVAVCPIEMIPNCRRCLFGDTVFFCDKRQIYLFHYSIGTHDATKCMMCVNQTKLISITRHVCFQKGKQKRDEGADLHKL